jgi:hypothetical protein
VFASFPILLKCTALAAEDVDIRSAPKVEPRFIQTSTIQFMYCRDPFVTCVAMIRHVTFEKDRYPGVLRTYIHCTVYSFELNAGANFSFRGC